MKRHMTQMEQTKTKRLIERGITDIGEIQTQVFCHADKIREVLSLYDVEIPEPAPAPARKAAPKKKAVKKAVKRGGAAAAAAALDPIS